MASLSFHRKAAMSKYLKSLIELTALTYATSFLGTITAAGFDLFNVSAVQAAAGAALPSALVVVYGALARLKGDYNSPLAVDTRQS